MEDATTKAQVDELGEKAGRSEEGLRRAVQTDERQSGVGHHELGARKHPVATLASWAGSAPARAAGATPQG